MIAAGRCWRQHGTSTQRTLLLVTSWQRTVLRNKQLVTQTSRRFPAFFSTDNKNRGKEEEASSIASSFISTTLLDTTARGLGQVIFLNSSHAGMILGASLAASGQFSLAACALMGSATSTVTAQHLLPSNDAVRNGLYSYNGALVGCASAVFLSNSAIVTTIVGSMATPFVTHTLGQHYLQEQPQWTYAFNGVMLSMLLANTKSAVVVETAETPTATTTTAFDVVVGTPLHSLSQIFVVEHAVTGLGIGAAIAMYSPQLAGHALSGAVVGSSVAYLAMGAPLADVAAGLWGYNAALTSMAMAVFAAPKSGSTSSVVSPVWILSVSAAAVTSVVQGGIAALLPVPCLTLPFCVTASVIYPLLLKNRLSYVGRAKDPHSPERNMVE